MSLKLTIVVASTRPGRAGPAIGKWVESVARSNGGFDIEVADLVDIALPLLDEAAHPARRSYELDHTKRWSEIVGRSDAFIFVTPEYDYFAPASLVNAIQVLFHEWAYKPASVVSYGGISGGLRSTQVLRQLLVNVNVMPINQTVPIPFFAQHVADAVFTPEDRHTTAATVMFDELVKWATALQPLRAPKGS